MRLLMVHNFYGSSAPSGENQVFETEKALLQEHGHEVLTFTRHSDEIRNRGIRGAIQGAFATPWNPWMARALRRMVDDFRPDVVHVHNTFPLISPSIFHAIGNRSAKVLTLHNYRLFCPAAIPLRNGSTCTDCLDNRTVRPALKYGCYRGSRLTTAPLAICVALHRAIGTWTKMVDAFVVFTDFQRDLAALAGLPAAQVHVKPNFYQGNPAPCPWVERGDHAVFAGRLTSEKGIESLVRAWNLWGDTAPELRIVGDGPLRIMLEQISTQPSIQFLGQLSFVAAQKEIANAKLLILPSECFEGFPMVVREALAFGTPAAVSNIGPLPHIINHGHNGIVFEAANRDSLLDVVRRAWNDPGYLEKLGQGARFSFEKKYTAQANYKTLVGIYKKAIENKVGKQ